MTFRKTVLIAGAALTGCLGCQSVPEGQIDIFDYLEHLRLIDDQHVTDAELEFEAQYPNVQLYGYEENLDRWNVGLLGRTIDCIPGETLERLNLEVYFAEPREGEELWFPWPRLGGAFCHGNRLVLLECDESHSIESEMSSAHEIAHTIHRYLPNREEFENEWQNLTINGQRMAEIYGDRLVTSGDEGRLLWRDGSHGPKNGFARPYGTTDLKEDVATIFEMMLSMMGNRTISDGSSETIFAKAQLLVRYGFLKPETYSRFTSRCEIAAGDTSACLEHLLDEDMAVRMDAWTELINKDNGTHLEEVLDMVDEINEDDACSVSDYIKKYITPGYLPRILEIAEDGGDVHSAVAISYFIRHDSEGEYKNLVLELAEEDVFLKIEAFEYLCSIGADRREREHIENQILEEEPGCWVVLDQLRRRYSRD